MAQKGEDVISSERLTNEARRVLRRMCEKGAVLAVAKGLDKAVVVRETGDGNATRTALVDRPVAEALALKGWIGGKAHGRITRYGITAAGRAELNRLMAKSENAAAQGFAEATADFHGKGGGASASAARFRSRFVADSPLLALARRKGRDGKPFLSDDLVAAGERLREDFELSQMGPNVTQNWQGFLTAGVSTSAPRQGTGGPTGARERVAAALRDLGEGLADVTLRCCCQLEGLETAEKRLGWSARSGKIVLRIALMRLAEHYRANADGAGDYIG